MAQCRFADRIDVETDIKTLLMVDNIAAVKKKSRFDHEFENFTKI